MFLFTCLASLALAVTPTPYCRKAKKLPQCEATRALVKQLTLDHTKASWSDQFDWAYVRDDESDMVFDFWSAVRTKTKYEPKKPIKTGPEIHPGALAELDPPATTEERSLYDKVKGDEAEVKKFLVTRKYVRKPEGRFPMGEFSFDYCIGEKEADRMFELMLDQKFASGAPK